MTHVYSSEKAGTIASPLTGLSPEVGEKLPNQIMRALTLWQPWASFLALGLKHYETRSWSTNYRGKLLIHAACRKIKQEEIKMAWDVCQMAGKPEISKEVLDFAYPPRGSVIAIAELTQCSEMTWLPVVNPPWGQISLNSTCSGLSDLEKEVGIWQPGRYAWKLENIQSLPQPVPCKGGQRLWNPSPEIIQQVLSQL